MILQQWNKSYAKLHIYVDLANAITIHNDMQIKSGKHADQNRGGPGGGGPGGPPGPPNNGPQQLSRMQQQHKK